MFFFIDEVQINDWCLYACTVCLCTHFWAGRFGYAPVQKGAKSKDVAVNPFCWRLIALIALALLSGFGRKGTSVTSWVIHLHSSSPLFSAADQWREGMSYLPQTTLQGRGLDDISWNKAAESAEQSRSCWWVCKWAVSAVESSLKNTLFQYVTGRKKSSLLGCSHQMHSINCPLTSGRCPLIS